MLASRSIANRASWKGRGLAHGRVGHLVLPPCSCDSNANCANLVETEALSSLQSASQPHWCPSFSKFSQALSLDLALSRAENSKSLCTTCLQSERFMPFVCAIASGVRPWRSGMCRSLWSGETQHPNCIARERLHSLAAMQSLTSSYMAEHLTKPACCKSCKQG